MVTSYQREEREEGGTNGEDVREGVVVLTWALAVRGCGKMERWKTYDEEDREGEGDEDNGENERRSETSEDM